MQYRESDGMSTSTGKCEVASEYNRVYFGWAPETDTGVAKNNSDSSNTISEVSDPYSSMKNNPIYWRNTKYYCK